MTFKLGNHSNYHLSLRADVNATPPTL